MKNRITISINLILSVAIYQNVFSQQWTGASNSSGTITRSGNVEIDSNGQALTIGTSGYSDKYIQFRKSSTYGVRIGLHAVTHGTASGIGLIQTGGGKGFGIKVNSNMDWVNVSNPEFYIEQNGNVGIGTTSPSNKLDVAGTIRAEEVKVETGWADYVFKEDYNLKSLDEVSTFITENGHLPNIPTAKEVKENGIKLGEMNAKLLEKIEELTLYVIEQNEKTELLVNENQKMKGQNEELLRRIEKLENNQP